VDGELRNQFWQEHLSQLFAYMETQIAGATDPVTVTVPFMRAGTFDKIIQFSVAREITMDTSGIDEERLTELLSILEGATELGLHSHHYRLLAQQLSSELAEILQSNYMALTNTHIQTAYDIDAFIRLYNPTVGLNDILELFVAVVTKAQILFTERAKDVESAGFKFAPQMKKNKRLETAVLRGVVECLRRREKITRPGEGDSPATIEIVYTDPLNGKRVPL